MKYLKTFESPDYLEYKGKHRASGDVDAIPFGRYNGKMYMGNFFKEKWHVDIIVEDEDGNKIKINRSDFEYPGRLWVTHKVMSLWSYPSKEEWPTFISELENAYFEKIGQKENIWNEFDVEVPSEESDDIDWLNTKIISVKDYSGTKKISKDYYNQHIESPLTKKKRPIYYQKDVPLAWKQRLHRESICSYKNFI